MFFVCFRTFFSLFPSEYIINRYLTPLKRSDLMVVRWTPERAVRVRALTGEIVVCLGKALYSISDSLHPGV